jgi:DNA polymerase-3 subunit delta'
MKSSVFPWHTRPLADVEEAIGSGRLAHGLLIEGPEGLGKLALAFQIARRVLGIDGRGSASEPPSHADFRWVTLEEGERGPKKQIGIDQIRSVCAELAMTSYSGGWKVAVIWPADRLTLAAANSLLKTLEEPAPRTLIILVRSRLDTLPATIASRCQRIRLSAPVPAQALAWLEDAGGQGARWDRLLSLAGGAPLLAMRFREEGFEALDEEMTQGLVDVILGRMDPLDLAARAAKRDLGEVLRWLEHFVGELVRVGMGGQAPGIGAHGLKALQTVLQRIPLPRLFRYLDEVRAASARADGALNAQLVLENLLAPWADRLEPVTGAAEQGILADR